MPEIPIIAVSILDGVGRTSTSSDSDPAWHLWHIQWLDTDKIGSKCHLYRTALHLLWPVWLFFQKTCIFFRFTLAERSDISGQIQSRWNEKYLYLDNVVLCAKELAWSVGLTVSHKTYWHIHVLLASGILFGLHFERQTVEGNLQRSKKCVAQASRIVTGTLTHVHKKTDSSAKDTNFPIFYQAVGFSSL